ncbi:leucine-rich repeat-containing protein 74B-like [Watersipora subatra]|uniref:leucine-rich repeat-containing protein 74B-like n=1 Tax=Watersipora subatra TaxID=2589382 RepID=UPI00355B0C31
MESLEACQRVASSIGVSETMWRQGGRWVKIKRQCSKSQRLSEKSGTDESFYLGTSDGSAGMLDGTTMSRKSGLDDHESTDSDCCYLEEDFSDNEEPESIHDLMECISIRSRSFHLETVSLRYNLLRDEHVKTLCVTLMYNKSVKQLDLRCCQLSSQSCQYVCEMLSHNHVITNLDLSENSLRTTGLIMLRDCLLLNMAISKLYLDFNDFTDSDAIHLYAILKVKYDSKQIICK